MGKHWPIDPATPVSSPFGYRATFAVPGSADWLAGLHDGTDFAADYGTPVYAAHAGTLTSRLDPGGYGQYAEINGDGLMTQYGHVRYMWLIPDGTWVEPGTLIAGVGSEGMSTGPHLHFRLHVDGTPTDPIPWLADAAWNPGGTPVPDLTVEQQVYDWAASEGLSAAGTAGIMGNLQAESGMDPGIVEGGSHDLADLLPGVREGIGLLQWSYTRREDLLSYAASVGKPWQDVATQLDFMRGEVAWGYEAMWAGLQLASDPRVASALFASTFVRPGVYGARDDDAADFYDRILAGEFGAAPIPPTPPPYVPVHEDAYLGDDMATTLIIDIIDPPAGIHPVWEYTGACLTPFLDGSLSGAFERQQRSWGTFLELYRRYLNVTRLGLDGVPVEKQLRDQAAAALAKFNGA